MFKTALMTAVMAFGFSASAANVELPIVMKTVTQIAAQPINPMVLLNWKIGSTVDYNMNAGFISGKIHSQVREATPQGFWVQQDMDMGFLGAQKVEIHYNKDDGSVIELLVNGQKQDIPDASNSEIKETKHDRVTVPAGTYDCIYAKILDKSKNEESEVWVNPTIVPIGGMIKTKAPSQLGEVTIEMTAFKI